MRTRLKRLLMVVATIVMATHVFAEGKGDKLEVMDNMYHLIFQVDDPNKHTVIAMGTANADILEHCTICVHSDKKDDFMGDESFWKTYNVNMIGDYAFEGVHPNIKEVVLQCGASEGDDDKLHRYTSYQGYLYPRRQEGHHQVN